MSRKTLLNKGRTSTKAKKVERTTTVGNYWNQVQTVSAAGRQYTSIKKPKAVNPHTLVEQALRSSLLKPFVDTLLDRMKAHARS